MNTNTDNPSAQQDQDHIPDSGRAPDEPLSVAQLSEFAEWLEARLDALNTRFDRFDQISTRNTRQFSDDMKQTQAVVTHLHERVGQLTASHERGLRTILQSEIRSALEEDRHRLARQARRRALQTLAIVLFVTAALIAVIWFWLFKNGFVQ